MSCDGDALTPAGYGRRLADELPNAALEVLEGCGHFPMHERTRATNHLLSDFLHPEPTT